MNRPQPPSRWGRSSVRGWLALRTDNLNERSQHASTRLGLVYEGTLRSHMRRQDGTRRDSLYYSLLSDEWPTVRDRLRARVATKTTT